jgi:hypothetical protein
MKYASVNVLPSSEERDCLSLFRPTCFPSETALFSNLGVGLLVAIHEKRVNGVLERLVVVLHLGPHSEAPSGDGD